MASFFLILIGYSVIGVIWGIFTIFLNRPGTRNSTDSDTFILNGLFWPITVPIGIVRLLNQIDSTRWF